MPLPPPPKATFWWVAAAVSGFFGISSLAWALTPEELDPNYPISAEFYVTPEAVDVRFDVSDMSYISIVRLNNGVLTREDEFAPIEKGQYSTGDGRYYLRVDAPRIAVISSTKSIGDMAIYLQAAQIAPDPLEALVDQVKANITDSDIVISPALEVR